jgi:hypothetical protein
LLIRRSRSSLLASSAAGTLTGGGFGQTLLRRALRGDAPLRDGCAPRNGLARARTDGEPELIGNDVLGDALQILQTLRLFRDLAVDVRRSCRRRSTPSGSFSDPRAGGSLVT